MAEKKSLRDLSDPKLKKDPCESLEENEEKHHRMFLLFKKVESENFNRLIRKFNKEESNCNPSKKVMKDMASSSHGQNKIPNLSSVEGASSSQQQRDKSKFEYLLDAVQVFSDEYYEQQQDRLREKIKEVNGSEVKFLLQKNLTASDVAKYQARMSIPPSKIKNEFLTENEKKLLNKREGNNKRYVGMNVLMLDPSLRECEICFKKWPSDNGFSYYLTKTWNDTVENNNLKENDTVQLWSFRVDSQLCFALVKA